MNATLKLPTSTLNSFKSLNESLNKYKTFSELSTIFEYNNKLIEYSEKNHNFNYIASTINYYNSFSEILNSVSSLGLDKKIHFFANYNIKKYSDFSNIKNLQYFSIINNINASSFENLKTILEIYQIKNLSLDEAPLRPIEKVIPQFIGYSFKDDSKISVDEAYEDSYISKIVDLSFSIFNTFKAINQIVPGFFNYCDSTLDLSYYLKDIADDERKFSYIVNTFFKAIYESSGIDSNKIFKISEICCNKDISSDLLLIKYLRNYTDHVSEKLSKDKIKKVHAFFDSAIGSVIPVKKNEWILSQYHLYLHVDKLLKLVLEELKKNPAILN